MADQDLAPDGGEAVDVPVEGAQEPQDGQEATEPTEPPSIEDIASKMGWAPQDQWRGDPERWKPAHEFVTSTVDINTKLSSKLENVEKQLGTLARTSAAVTEQALAKQREELLRARDEAFDSGDKQAFHQADQQLDQLEKQLPTVPNEPPETAEFRQRHQWFGKDQEATNWAITRAEQLALQNIGVPRQLAIIEREAKDLFPEHFPARAKVPPLNQPGARGAAPAKKGYSALPADAKAAADDYVKRGVFKNGEEYAKIYFEQEGV